MNNKVLIARLSNISGTDSANIRTRNLISGLLELGYEIDLLGISDSDKALCDDLRLRFIELERISLYQNIKKETHMSAVKKIIIKLMRIGYHYFFVYDNTYFMLKKIDFNSLLLEEFYDSIITISDPKTSHLIINKISKNIKYNKWYQYWGDPFTLDITRKNIYPRFILRALEKKILKNANKIIYVSPFTLKQQQNLFPSFKTKMMFLPPAYAISSYNQQNNKKDKSQNDKYVISYIGSYPSKIRNIMPLYDAIKKLNNSFKTYIIGDSDISLQQTANITLGVRQNTEEIEAESDLHICLLNKEGGQIPSKVYYLSASTKPILIILDGELKQDIKAFFKSFNRYYFCENNTTEIFQAINRIKEENKKFEIIEDFSPKNIAERFMEI